MAIIAHYERVHEWVMLPTIYDVSACQVHVQYIVSVPLILVLASHLKVKYLERTLSILTEDKSPYEH